MLIVVVAIAIITPFYFVPALNRVAAPVLGVLQVVANAVHFVVLGVVVLFVVFVIGAQLWWRRKMREERREARERDGFEVREMGRE